MAILPEMDLIKIHTTKLDRSEGSFVVEPLLPGYGQTLGNSLRRVLLSSIPGAAITTVRINDASHEFSTLQGVTEDLVQIIMNLKQVRLKLHGDEPVTLKLGIKGPKTVTAAQFAPNAQVEVMNPDAELATLDKKAELSIEAKVERGRGYLPIEKRKGEKLPLGMIAIDAIFTPIRKVNFTIDNTRVGQETNFDKLMVDITTDGTINPAQAIKTASAILNEHFSMITAIEPPQPSPAKTAKTSKKAKPKAAPKKSKSKTKK